MVLYHCISAYHIIHAMIHKNLNHTDEKSVLIIADFSANKFENYLELQDFFDEVILFPYREIEHNTDTIIDAVTKMYEEKVPYEINEFNEIYVAAAHYYFSLYLIEKGISFHFIEDGCGILSKPKVSYDIVMNYAPVQANIAQTYGMFDGNNDYVIDRICNKSAQSFSLSDSNIVDFDLITEMTKCDSDYIDTILKFFRVEKSDMNWSNSVLVFTQQLANLGILTFEEQVLIYQLVADFFVPDKKLVFKTHPDDVMYYKLIFPESQVLKGRYPAELLPFTANSIADTSLTIFSSSVLSVRSAFKENIFCGYDFDKTFKRIDSYYFALDVLCNLKKENYNFYGYGLDVKLIDNLQKYSLNSDMKIQYPHILKCDTDKKSVYIFDELNYISDVFKNQECKTDFDYEETKIAFTNPLIEEEKEKTVQLIDDVQNMNENFSELHTQDIVQFLLNINEDDVIVFLNTQKDYSFYQLEYKSLFESMIPVIVNKKKNREENMYLDEKSIVLYFYSKNDEVKNMIENYENYKKLENAGMEEYVSKLTCEQRRIAILEGMLEATEKRLMYYIEKEKNK